MARNYYSLVAGLREYTLDSEKKGFDARAIIDEISEQLSDSDKDCLRLFYTYYDIGNIIAIVSGREQFSPLGNFTREQLEQEIKTPEELPEFIAEILLAYANPEDTEFDQVDTRLPLERSLYEAYYEKCEHAGCRFVRQWYGFDRNLRNVTAAYKARRLGLPIREALVGEGYVVDTLARSSAADFGLRGEVDYIDRITDAVSAETNMVDKEHTVDLIRWEMADEFTTFDYFDINGILGYLVKINIVQRWVALDATRGRELFRRLLDSFSSLEIIQRAENENENKKQIK